VCCSSVLLKQEVTFRRRMYCSNTRSSSICDHSNRHCSFQLLAAQMVVKNLVKSMLFGKFGVISHVLKIMEIRQAVFKCTDIQVLYFFLDKILKLLTYHMPLTVTKLSTLINSTAERVASSFRMNNWRRRIRSRILGV